MLARNKTKIVCTIGPASRSAETLEELMNAGMNIARLNFSHGEFDQHKHDINTIREVAKKLNRPVAIMADLPGPKIRIGDLAEEEIVLVKDQKITLTTEPTLGTLERISVNLPNLHETVQPGKKIFLNDGFIKLEIEDVVGKDILCRVEVGGSLRSRKGLNVPEAALGIDVFTSKDKDITSFALENGVDAISLSFVENGEDIIELRDFAAARGYSPFLIAKIERSQAIHNLDSILAAADGIMVARGDLGVEIPICKIPGVQKQIVQKANAAGKPVITATHMLESMITNIIPTRAEATDVANAILDGTDCVMLSGESAVGMHPAAAVATLSSIAIEAENIRACRPDLTAGIEATAKTTEIIASSVETSVKQLKPAAVIVPTRSGATTRNITRYRLPVWVLGVSSQKKTCQDLVFSYGVIPVHESDHPTHWRSWIHEQLKQHGLKGNWAVLTEGPSEKYPDRNTRIELIDLQKQ
ncbi:pyruvate kinase [Desulfosediminicola ganghwensis]|uniref:pyruvate kinase n=1 Tax=Desulfosediminicola ganghwensis TaxID=2569540 RepID=UPI0010AD851D|nr:pyruvate kinase [Desulfosediminicola ganghwensis]